MGPLSVVDVMDTIQACVVPAADAKNAKDVLKARKWLDEDRRPGNADGGFIAFPIVVGAIEMVQSAVGELPELATAEMQSLASSTFIQKKKAPPQKSKEKAVAAKEARAAAPRPSWGTWTPKTKTQERSFGAGKNAAASDLDALPAAKPVRRIVCPPGSDAAWLRANVFGAKCMREPAVLTGLNIGPCVGGWTAKRLEAAACVVPAVSVHVCPDSRTVDLAGHRAPNTPRNFEFRKVPFKEAVLRCNGQVVGSSTAAAGPGRAHLPAKCRQGSAQERVRLRRSVPGPCSRVPPRAF
jgi:hypothetical protein